MPLLTPSAYFPPSHWFAQALHQKGWRIEAHENYQRRGYRNRTRIGGPNKLLTLTVPLAKGKNQRTPITEVRINPDTDWRRDHWQSIRTAYGRSPFFDFYSEPLLNALMVPHERLYELNAALLRTIISLLQLPIPVTETVAFQPDPPPPPSTELAPYPQVFTDRFGYRGGLSILDALFCLGPSFITQPLAHPDSPPLHG